MKNPAIILIALAFLVAEPTFGAEDGNEAIVAKLQGTFEGTEIKIQGNQGTPEEAKEFVLIFKGSEVTFQQGEDAKSARKSTFKVDASKKPMHIDLTHLDGNERGGVQPCIFALDGDTLTFCAPLFPKSAKAHPKEFKTQQKDGLVLVVLKRKIAAKAAAK